uniref:CcmF_ii n=1 Tax=Oxytricha trifallax TaxID=1172189 RepID=G9HRD3_9SPIT|nr:ccmF_ii [Oxytricha trifallax]
MLFFKLYNWLKYKTLPSSFLFKNRLFIERDSKHRKIMNNFGLVFRNSKWSDYANNNVTLDFKNIYFKWFFIFVLILIFLYLSFYLKFFNNFFFNSLTFFFWFAIDSLDYYLSFFLWSFTSFFSVVFSKIYFFINNTNQTNFKDFYSSKFNSQVGRNLNNSNFNSLSKNDLNWILYSWLISKNNYNNSNLIEILFDSKVSKNFWNSNYDFFLIYTNQFFF